MEKEGGKSGKEIKAGSEADLNHLILYLLFRYTIPSDYSISSQMVLPFHHNAGGDLLLPMSCNREIT